jgi:hypothetical protein
MDGMIVKFVANDHGNPPGRLADAELHFTSGPLDGLKLIGVGIWERRNSAGRNVTFPARQYSVNGERRSFALLRPIVDAAPQDRIRDLMLQAYACYEQLVAEERVSYGRFIVVRCLQSVAWSVRPIRALCFTEHK